MSELGDLYAAWREHKREKKRANRSTSLGLLAQHGHLVEVLSQDHYRIGAFDFWPSTGLFINRETQKRGRGVFKLMEALK